MKLEEAIKECQEQINYKDIEGDPLLSAYFSEAIQKLIDTIRGQEGTIKSQKQTIDAALDKAEMYQSEYNGRLRYCESLENKISDAIKILQDES